MNLVVIGTGYEYQSEGIAFTMSAIDEEVIYRNYKEVFYANFSPTDLVYLADVTSDGITDMLLVQFSDDIGSLIEGFVYIPVNGTVTQIYRNQGANFHVGRFYA